MGLPAPDPVIGGINFYGSGKEPFDAEAVELADVFASYAAVVLVNGASYTTTANLPDQVRDAFRTRTTVETAKGVLMARNQYADREAFGELQRRAEAERRALHEWHRPSCRVRSRHQYRRKVGRRC